MSDKPSIIHGQPGLAGAIDVANANTYGGCYYPRYNRLAGTLGTVSRHSWGMALDTNTSSNPQGGEPRMSCDVVRIFRKHGFAWGGNFTMSDGMHFEWVGEPRDQLPYPSRYCPNLVPLPLVALQLRPDFCALILVYWGIHQPRSVGFTVAFLLGLGVDLADARLFGQHAFVYVALLFAAIGLSRRVLNFSLIGQAVVGLALVQQSLDIGPVDIEPVGLPERSCVPVEVQPLHSLNGRFDVFIR